MTKKELTTLVILWGLVLACVGVLLYAALVVFGAFHPAWDQCVEEVNGQMVEVDDC